MEKSVADSCFQPPFEQVLSHLGFGTSDDSSRKPDGGPNQSIECRWRAEAAPSWLGNLVPVCSVDEMALALV